VQEDPTPRSTRHPLLAAASRAAGFRHVDVVQLIVGGNALVAQATGVLHRYPQTVRISLATADRLVAAGAPVQIQRARADAGSSS
jgi:hypothetical protein